MLRMFIGTSIAMLIIAGCAELGAAHQSQVFAKYIRELHVVTAPCAPRSSTHNDELLIKTCEYVVKNRIEVTAHPNEWKIMQIQDEMVEGQVRLAVHFSCCGRGDVAFFDKETRQICAYARKNW